ncbi:MAG: hypothetical protein OEN48_17880 [Betaproteobacteria bacterium]|nr:hypothetical protein [Betaproteobacteria bacterium]
MEKLNAPNKLKGDETVNAALPSALAFLPLIQPATTRPRRPATPPQARPHGRLVSLAWRHWRGAWAITIATGEKIIAVIVPVVTSDSQSPNVRLFKGSVMRFAVRLYGA